MSTNLKNEKEENPSYQNLKPLPPQNLLHQNKFSSHSSFCICMHVASHVNIWEKNLLQGYLLLGNCKYLCVDMKNEEKKYIYSKNE